MSGTEMEAPSAGRRTSAESAPGVHEDHGSLEPLNAKPPFVWPEPRVREGQREYSATPPFADLARAAQSIFGTATAPRAPGLALLESWLRASTQLNVRLIVGLYPTCGTGQSDLARLRQLADEFKERLQVRIKAYGEVTDRPTNAICLSGADSAPTYMVTGPAADLGCEDDKSDGSAQLVFRAEPVLVESFSRHFTWLWSRSAKVDRDAAVHVPELTLPEGSAEAARRWREYVRACHEEGKRPETREETARVDPATGEVALFGKDGAEVKSPTVEIGVPPLDQLAERIARLYELGDLVSVDKVSRLPPLDAPVDPSWFGDSSEVQRGNVTRKVSMRISIIDEATLKELDKKRQALRVLLNRFTFGLAENMRWMPHSAKKPFEAELARTSAEGQKLITDLLKGNVAAFVTSKTDLLVADLKAMNRELGRPEEIPSDVIEKLTRSLQERLSRASAASFMPKLTYSTVSFKATTNAWASPWEQAYSLLSDVADFPRKVLTDSFFLRGIKTPESDLLKSMNVAGDNLLAAKGGFDLKDRARSELALLKRIDGSALQARRKCELVCTILDGGDLEAIEATLNDKATQ